MADCEHMYVGAVDLAAAPRGASAMAASCLFVASHDLLLAVRRMDPGPPGIVGRRGVATGLAAQPLRGRRAHASTLAARLDVATRAGCAQSSECATFVRTRMSLRWTRRAEARTGRCVGPSRASGAVETCGGAGARGAQTVARDAVLSRSFLRQPVMSRSAGLEAGRAGAAAGALHNPVVAPSRAPPHMWEGR